MPLTTKNPDYSQLLSNLYSRQQAGQEFQSFSRFEPSADGETQKFVLAFGTSLLWEVRGGSNFWKEYKDEYQSSWDVEFGEVPEKNKLDLLSIELKSQGTTNAELKVHCKVPSTEEAIKSSFSYTVTLLQRGSVGKHLLTPKEHRHQVHISCEPPHSERLLWSQPLGFDPKNRQLLPRSRFVEHTRTHFVLTSSRHSVRYLVLDRHGFAMVNHESIITEVSSSPAELARLHALTAD